MLTEPNPVSLGGNSADSFKAANGPVLLPIGANLPMHVVRGVLNLGTGLIIDGQKFKTGVPMGSFGSLVRHVRGSGSPTEPGPQRFPGTLSATPVLTATPVPAVRPR